MIGNVKKKRAKEVSTLVRVLDRPAALLRSIVSLYRQRLGLCNNFLYKKEKRLHRIIILLLPVKNIDLK